jgi:hypothetical protein
MLGRACGVCREQDGDEKNCSEPQLGPFSPASP